MTAIHSPPFVASVKPKAQFEAIVVVLVCTMAYLLRSSLPTYLYGAGIEQLLLAAELASLALASGYAISHSGVRLRTPILIMVCATSASVLNCENPSFSGTRWLAWVMLLLAIGPANKTSIARSMRSVAWRQVITGAVIVTVLSGFWAAAGLPNLGVGAFTGVMWHSMVLSPTAALVGVWAIVRFSDSPRAEWGILYGLSVAVCMIAASRSALVALAFATAIAFALRMKRYPLLSITAIVLTASLVIAPDGMAQLLGRAAPSILTEGLATKSFNNSREHHWRARWDEFESSPMTGVGFASGWLDTAGVSNSGSVESGSSYIGILSMTGVLGALGCLAPPVALAWSYWRRVNRLSMAVRTEIACFAGFWFVHLGAEGYIYAVGSLLGLFVWLWFGRVFDLLENAAPPQQRGLRHSHLLHAHSPAANSSRNRIAA